VIPPRNESGAGQEAAIGRLKTCTTQAQKRSSKSAASAHDLLQLRLQGGLPLKRARARICEDKVGDPVARALLARAGSPVQTLEVGQDRIGSAQARRCRRGRASRAYAR